MIDALRASVCDGLLLVPAHTYSNIREVPVFDVRNTKPCIGAVPGVAVGIANKAFDSGDKTIVRSLHPAHSVVAFGKNAYDYVANDAFAATPMPKGCSYQKLKEQLSNRGISLVDYELHGDSGLSIISLYLDKDINKWVYQKPVERSNNVSQEEFDTFEDTREYIERVYIKN